MFFAGDTARGKTGGHSYMFGKLMFWKSDCSRALPLLRACVFGALVAGLCLAPLAAQVSTADILGTVTDSSGAVLVDAKITVENPETNLTRTATTNSSGNYVISLLPAGRYNI